MHLIKQRDLSYMKTLIFECHLYFDQSTVIIHPYNYHQTFKRRQHWWKRALIWRWGSIELFHGNLSLLYFSSLRTLSVAYHFDPFGIYLYFSFTHVRPLFPPERGNLLFVRTEKVLLIFSGNWILCWNFNPIVPGIQWSKCI